MIKFSKINPNKLVNLIVILACVWYLKNCGTPTQVEVIPEGYISPTEFEYRMQVIDLIKTNQNLEYENRGFKNKYETDTVIINDSDKHGLVNMLTDRYRKR